MHDDFSKVRMIHFTNELNLKLKDSVSASLTSLRWISHIHLYTDFSKFNTYLFDDKSTFIQMTINKPYMVR